MFKNETHKTTKKKRIHKKGKKNSHIFHKFCAWLRLFIENIVACFDFIFIVFNGFKLIRVVCLVIVVSSNNSIISGLIRFFCKI